MAGFQFELVTPEKLLYSGVVESVVVPGREGDFEVLAQHAPMMSTIRAGVISVNESGGERKRLVVLGGFAEVNPTGLTILAEEAIDADEFGTERLNAEIKAAEDAVANAPHEQNRLAALSRLLDLQNLASARSH